MESHSHSSDFSQLRRRANLSIDELADRLGFSARTIYRWDRGEGVPRTAALHYLRSVVDSVRSIGQELETFRFIDLFAGIGGLRRGFEPLGGKCVYTSEWNKFSKVTYLANYRCEHEIDGDITQVDVNDIPEHDVLLAGFPCQPFSIAGVSKKNALNKPHGFRCEAQGTLFFDVARIIEAHRPRAFVLENVKNLVNHDKGRTFQVIHRTLAEDLRYRVYWKGCTTSFCTPGNKQAEVARLIQPRAA